MADRYWVGGTANWDGTAGTKWATTSGGAGGASVPTSADNVFFDANSGAVTVTLNAIGECNNLNFTGFTGTWSAVNYPITIYGNLTVVAAMTWNGGAMTFNGATTGKTVTTNGKTLTGSSLTFNTTGGGWILQDALVCDNIGVYSGTLDTNSKNVTVNSSITLSGGTLTCGASTIIALSWVIFGGTLNAGTSTIKIDPLGTSSFATATFSFAATYYNFEIYGAQTNVNFAANSVFTNLKIAPITSSAQVSLSANITVSGTFTSNGTSVQNRNFIYSNLRNVQRGINAATVSIQDTDFRDIDANGAAVPWALTTQRAGDLGNNSDINFPAPVTRYAVAPGNWSSTAVWSTTSGGATGASVPLPQDTAVFDASTGPGTYTFNVSNIGGVDASACGARVLTLPAPINVYKSFILSPALTFTHNTYQILFLGAGSNTINTATKQIYYAYIGGNYTLAGDLSLVSNLLLNGGVFVANGKNVTCAYVDVNLNTFYWDSLTVYMGSGTWRLTNSGTCWSYVSGSLFTETSTIEIAASAASTYTFAGGGQTYYGFLVSGSTGASTVAITGNNTFNTISSTKSNAYTLRFTNGQTTTVTNWSVNGTAGNIITIISASAGSRFNLTKAGGGLTVSNFVSVKDSNASPANTFYAVNSTNAGNNVNWTFNFPSSQGNLLAFF
jgi:phage baseplate assembly protein gpV